MLAFTAPNFVLLQGVIIGLSYGLLAVGLVLIYRTNRVVNFAQGQVGVIASFFLVQLMADFHLELWFALAPARILSRVGAPIVALRLGLAVSCAAWGFAMRAITENSYSARVSGVWSR